MKVLIYCSSETYSYYHFATELEIAIKHLKKGDEVYFLICDGSIESCESNVNHKKNICYGCINIVKNGLEIIGFPNENILSLDLCNYDFNINIPEFNTIQKLKNFTYQNIDFGMCVASTLISRYRNSKIDLVNNKAEVKKLLDSAIKIYLSVIDKIEIIKPDLIYIYNGRQVSSRPVLRAAQKLKIRTMVHERSGDNNKYYLTKNTYPHDLKYIKKDIIRFNLLNPVNENKARLWFYKRRYNQNELFLNFNKLQKKNTLPNNFDKLKRNITIYISSEDEFESVKEWENEAFYKSQNDFVFRLIDHYKNNSKFHFYLRMHPNLYKVDNIQTKELFNYDYPDNCFLIKSDSNIDSYSLMEKSEKVIVFRSTMGVESCFWGKPVILFGRAIYEDLNITYKVKNFKETFSLIEKQIESKNNENCLLYANWEENRGLELKYFEPDGYFKGRVLGKYINSEMDPKNIAYIENLTKDYF